MAEKLTVYQVDVETSSLSATGVHAISFVEYPAIERNFIALSAFAKDYNRMQLQEQRLATIANNLKFEVTGPALIPDFEILRMDNEGKLYAITFTKDAIVRIRDKFSKELNHRRTDQEHGIPLAGNTVVESWIVTELNKSSTDALMGEGSDIPVGSWMITMKVEDHDYYHREILSGNVKGFSVYGYFDYFEQAAKLSNQSSKKEAIQKMNTEAKNNKGVIGGIFASLATLFSTAAKEASAESLTKVILEDGTTEITINEDTNQAYYIVDGVQGDLVPDGDHILDDGRTLVIVDGRYVEIKDKVVDGVTEVVATGDEPAVAAELQTLAQFALSVGRSAADITKLAAKYGIAIRQKSETFSATRKAAKLCQLKAGESLASLKDAAKLATITARESLSILFDPASMKPMYLDQNSGEICFIDDNGGYLYTGDFVPAGSYNLADGSVLVVVEKTEIYEEGTMWEMTYTRSYVDYEASTVPIEVLVPWTKKATSEIAELAASQAEKLNAAVSELATIKAELATIKGQPAAKPVIVTNGEALSDSKAALRAMREGLSSIRNKTSKTNKN